MKKVIAYCLLMCWSAVVLMLAAAAPNVISDANDFLNGFVNHEFLNALGVILAITIASAGQLHLELNSIEEKYQTSNNFIKTRAGISSAVYWLVGLFFVSIILVVTKPLLSKDLPWAQTIFNGSSLLILIWYVLILVSIIDAVFKIKPK